MIKFLSLAIMTSGFALSLQAAIPQTKPQTAPKAILRGAGAIHGGVAAKGFSLLGVKNFPGKNGKIERVSIDIGNPLFANHVGAPGHFHIENSPENKRVVIQLSQMITSKVNEASLRRTFQKSPFVSSTEMLFDPQSQSTSLVLNLKKPVSVRAVPVAGKGQKTAQLNIDFFEDGLLKSKNK